MNAQRNISTSFRIFVASMDAELRLLKSFRQLNREQKQEATALVTREIDQRREAAANG